MPRRLQESVEALRPGSTLRTHYHERPHLGYRDQGRHPRETVERFVIIAIQPQDKEVKRTLDETDYYSWLHISDIHLRVSDTWSQDVVLKAMCERMYNGYENRTSPDFILLTGDIAFSGKSEEYKMADGFIDALITANKVPNDRIFCIPGNHDIDRSRQKLCFVGARQGLQSQNRIDALLSGEEDLQTLLEREGSYRQFQQERFPAQDRSITADGLAYVSRLTIEDVRIAIVGLDSAWLAEGGSEDHGKLLIGERQLINAIDLAHATDSPPHITVCMAHHPLHLLLDCDRQPVIRRIESSCHFFHCGHLHEPEVRPSGLKGCLTLAAGASFETRQTRNAF